MIQSENHVFHRCKIEENREKFREKFREIPEKFPRKMSGTFFPKIMHFLKNRSVARCRKAKISWKFRGKFQKFPEEISPEISRKFPENRGVFKKRRNVTKRKLCFYQGKIEENRGNFREIFGNSGKFSPENVRDISKTRSVARCKAVKIPGKTFSGNFPKIPGKSGGFSW